MFERLRGIWNPPIVEKAPSALRFGILGAARIGPDALIIPAKSHAEVIVAAVASRDEKKAKRYAAKHGIAKTYFGKDCYQRLIDDPEIDVIYNPLPNILHYEWSMRAMAAGKHVLIEKPIADTEKEAARLNEYAQEQGVVCLEAFHHKFHPSIQRLKEIVDSGELGKIKSMKADMGVPGMLSGLFFLKDDLRFQYDLGGGCFMDMGVYPLSALRYLTDSEPLSVTSATAIPLARDPTRVDRGMKATLQFPNDVLGELECDYEMPGWGPFGLIPRTFKGSVVVFLEGGEIELFNFVLPHFYHSITVRPTHGKPRTEHAYKSKDLGEEWWSSYRYQLEAFVDSVRGRKPATWTKAGDAAAQMKAVEEIYQRAGMTSRPASSFDL